MKKTHECQDKHCPMHNGMKTRGRVLVGKVASIYGQTAIIEWQRSYYLQKYERSESRRSRIKVHIPGCVNVNTGNKIKVMETRPISKTKHFVYIKNESN